jgi:hypothetical protein
MVALQALDSDSPGCGVHTWPLPHPAPTPCSRRAAEAWFERHGLPCPPGTAIAEHMLRVASDAAAIRHLLQTLALEPEGQPGSPPAAKRSASRAGLLAAAAVGGNGATEDGEGGLRPSPFDTSLGKLSPGLADAANGRSSGLSPSSSEASDLAGAASGGGGVAKPGAALPPRRRKASFGRQVSVMFWRTLVDIGEPPLARFPHPSRCCSALLRRTGGSCMPCCPWACSRTPTSASSRLLSRLPQCATRRCCCFTRWLRWRWASSSA